MKKQIYLLLIVFVTIILPSKGQFYDVGVMLGASNYMGELSNQELNGNHFHFATGVMGRYNYSKRISFSGHLYYGKISGNDGDHASKYWTTRNLSFQSNIYEIGIQNEINLTPLAFREGKYVAPYLFVGLSGFYFNPKAEFKGNMVELQPLGTEGQENIFSSMKKYKKVGLAIPFGGGIRFMVTEKVNLSFEMGMRKTVTDYLDDVSTYYPNIEFMSSLDPVSSSLSYRTPEINPDAVINPVGTKRGNPTNQDWLFFGGITVSINLTDKYGLEWDNKYRKFYNKMGHGPEPKTYKGGKKRKKKIRKSKKKKVNKKHQLSKEEKRLREIYGK